LTGAGGASGFYGSYFSNVDQTAAAINTAYAMTVNNVIGENGISVVSGSQITFTSSGTYDIQFSAQLHNNGGGGSGSTVQIWFRKNGTDIPDSATRIAVPTNTPYSVAAWDFMDNFAAGDNFQIMWSTNNTNIGIDHNTAVAPAPNIPSVIITVMQVMYNQLGPQGATGVQGATGATGAGTQGATGATGGMATADVQIFATTGSTTWTKPPNAKSVNIQLFGAGGGGGSGRKDNAAATSKSGGAGGGGGGYLNITVPANVLGDTESVTIGAGGAGAAGRTTNNANGITASSGGNTTFNSLVCQGGNGGGGGTSATATTASATLNSNAGGTISITANAGTGSPTLATVSTQFGGAGGGAGGSISNATPSVAFNAGSGGRSNVLAFAGGSAGVANTGLPGGAGTNNTLASTGLFAVGSGGGGGGAGLTVSGGDGGNGGFPAGGGGGGGATETGTTSGTGGTGADGLAIITTYF
jgi:hypothetical protein